MVSVDTGRSLHLAADIETADPTRETLKARATSAAATLRAHAAETDARASVSADSIELLRDMDLFKIISPRRYGGSELDFGTLSSVISILAEGCGSTAWVFAVLSENFWAVAQFSLEAQTEFWANPDARAAASLIPLNETQLADNGVLLNGDWPFASGCEHAGWAMLGVRAVNAAGGAETYQCLVPMDRLTIAGYWNVIGLRGTRSLTLSAKNLHVPSTHILRHGCLLEAKSPWRSLHPDMNLLDVPRTILAPITLGSVAVGLARSAVSLFIDYAKQRNIHNQEHLQLEFAEAAAEAETAASLLASVCALTERVTPGQLGLADIARSRRDVVYAAKLCAKSVQRLFRLTGAHGLFDDEPLQRVLRDSHAAAAHASQRWHTGAAVYAKFAFGLPIKQPI